MILATALNTDESCARAAAYGLIAACFRYPDRAWFDELKNPDHWDHWSEHLPTGDAVDSALVELRNWLERAGLDELAGVITRHAVLFGHTVRGSCPPYELEYGTDEILQRASELADISGFYTAFGLEFDSAQLERADHLGAECEFMSALCEKEAYAAQAEVADGADICHEAERKFLRSHLGRWLPAFAQRLADADLGFYGLAAKFAASWIESECRRLEVPHGSPYLELRPVDPERETEQNCGKEPCGGATQLTPLTLGKS